MDTVIRKINAALVNDKLMPYNAIKVRMNEIASPQQSDLDIKVVGGGDIVTPEGYPITESGGVKYVTNGTYDFVIKEKYGITELQLPSNVSMNMAQLEGCPLLTKVVFSNASIVDDVISLAKIPNIQNIQMAFSKFVGDVSGFASNAGITTLNVGSCPGLYGDWLEFAKIRAKKGSGSVTIQYIAFGTTNTKFNGISLSSYTSYAATLSWTSNSATLNMDSGAHILTASW